MVKDVGFVTTSILPLNLNFVFVSMNVLVHNLFFQDKCLFTDGFIKFLITVPSRKKYIVNLLQCSHIPQNNKLIKYYFSLDVLVWKTLKMLVFIT